MACLKRRSGVYYAQYYIGSKQKRVSLGTDSYQVAKEKLRQLESSLAAGDANPLPTKTPLARVLSEYVRHIRTVKTAKSAQTDVYYLREMFGPVCEELGVTSRRTTAKKLPPLPGVQRRRGEPVIEAACIEDIRTAQIADFIQSRVRRRGIQPKTANRYREIACRLFNWALAALVTAGQAHESKEFERLMRAVRPPRWIAWPLKVAGDKGYSYPRVREFLAQRGIRQVIPQRSDQVRHEEKRTLDRRAYKRRARVEQSVGWMKENRRVGTRYDTLASSLMAFVNMAIMRRYLRILAPEDPSERA